jgi:hypothetical protein
MTTPYRLILCAAAAVATACAGRAADPIAPPSAGHVLVLLNERTVEGDIERVGEQYRVRHVVGETWVPAEKVLRLCADMSDAYLVLRARANLNDPDECLRLARWCHTHGLTDQALENVQTAVRLNPSHAEARRLLAGLLRAPTLTPAAPAKPEPAPASVEVPELNSEARVTFATKVEPILMNACAGCHSANRGGAFKLTRSYDVTSSNRVSLQQNLAAVLAQVNLQQPQDSKLLVKAITAHDPQARLAPLNSKQMAAYHTLEDWVQTTLASNPQLRERSPQPAPPTETKAVPAPTSPPAETKTAAAPRPSVPTPAVAPAPGAFAASRPAAEQTTPVDEFDPLLFNRQSPPPAAPKSADKP